MLLCAYVRNNVTDVSHMQAEQDPKMAKKMYLPLAEKMLNKFVKEDRMNALAELRLYIMVLEMVDKPEQVLRGLEGPLGMCVFWFIQTLKWLRASG